VQNSSRATDRPRPDQWAAVQAPRARAVVALMALAVPRFPPRLAACCRLTGVMPIPWQENLGKRLPMALRGNSEGYDRHDELTREKKLTEES
jgi:hypothetical protein